METRLTVQRHMFLLLLWALILQVAFKHVAASSFDETTNAASRNITVKNKVPASPVPARVCKSIEVRTMGDLQSLRNCVRVVGYVRFAYLPATITGNDTPNITTAVEEITDYLLVYRSHGLQSLAQIFPKLQIIRGRELLFNEFALAIYENRELSNLGLGSLLRIQAGNIRIESNPSLCYVETVNWVQLLGNSMQQHFFHKNNRPNNHCTLCARTGNDIVMEDELPENLRSHCWSLNMRQRRPATSSLVNCSSDCGLRGCDDMGKCCDHNCLSGCDGMHCYFCANLSLDGQCVDVCPQNYVLHQKRHCITSTKCHQTAGIPHAGVCVESCPKYHLITRTNGELYCRLVCSGHFVIHTALDVESLTGCATINGTLTIELTDIKVKITDLENAFKKVTEITGYLKVVNSPQLVTLHFLPNLISICGQRLVDDLYALYVVNNYYLTELWTPNQKVAIRNGSIYFHLNPRLCLNKIHALQDSIKEAKPLNNINISPHSNGERVVCDSFLQELNATVEDKNSTAARIKIDVFTKENIHIILGYVYFFKESPIQNASLYDGRHGCGHDNWRMEVNPTQNIRFIITKLKPYTQYAYFVKTLTMADYHIRADAYSKIQYFTTLPRKPGPVRKVYYTPIDAETLILHWWPPRRPNGDIEKYLIRYEKVNLHNQTNVTLSDHPDISRNSMDCDCEDKNPENSGPLPQDENFYNREKLIYDESLPDLIYVKIDDKRRIQRNVSLRDFDSNCARQRATTPNTINAFLDTTKKIRKIRKITDSEGKPQADTEGRAKSAKKKIETKDEDDDHDLEGDPNLYAAMRNLHLFNKRQEEIALRTQDTGPDNFTIIKPRPVCSFPNLSVKYPLQHNCQQMEIYEGIEVKGHIHFYKLSTLEKNQSYRISVRACVANLENACGPETSVLAQTMSMQQYILNDANTN